MPRKKIEDMSDVEKVAAWDRMIERQHGAKTTTTYQQRSLTPDEVTRLHELDNHISHLSLQRKKLNFKLEQLNKLITSYAQERMQLQKMSFITMSEKEE